jgi:hypothetical protein
MMVADFGPTKFLGGHCIEDFRAIELPPFIYNPGALFQSTAYFLRVKGAFYSPYVNNYERDAIKEQRN